MRNLLIGTILGLTLAAAGTWAVEPLSNQRQLQEADRAAQQQERWEQQTERMRQEQFRMQQQQRPPC
jgi:hypothetical protein